MADSPIGSLTEATLINNNDLFVLEQAGTAKKLTGQTLKNYVYLDLASVTSTTLPAGSAPTASYNPTTKVLTLGIPEGDTIESIEKTSTALNVDTYTITCASGHTGTFTVTNGLSMDRIEKTSGTGAPGTVDTYTVYLTDDSVAGTFNVYNGADGQGTVNSVNGKIATQGNVSITGSDIPVSSSDATKVDAALGNTVSYSAQAKTNAEKAQARANIGAISGDVWARDGWNQLVNKLNYQASAILGITRTGTFPIIHVSGTCTSTDSFTLVSSINTNPTHIYLIDVGADCIAGTRISYSSVDRTRRVINSGYSIVSIALSINAGVTIDQDFRPMLIDLTEIFGAGNEPTTVAEFKAIFPNDYYDYQQGGFGDLLWENASPSSAFASQDVNINLSSYKNVLIFAKRSNSSGVVTSFLGGVNDVTKDGLIISVNSNIIGMREFEVFNNYVHFYAGAKITTYGTQAEDNSYIVPLRIYGIR